MESSGEEGDNMRGSGGEDMSGSGSSSDRQGEGHFQPITMGHQAPRGPVSVTLRDSETWAAFHELTTEMIINRNGR